MFSKLINNSNEKQVAKIYDGEGNSMTLELAPTEIKWIDIN